MIPAAQTSPQTCYEVADSHPAARTTVIRRCGGADPARAASEALRSQVTLVPLTAAACDWFVRDHSWSGWRVAAPDPLAGRWIYTRPVDTGLGAWPPKTWLDCITRYERYVPDSDIPTAQADTEQSGTDQTNTAQASSQAQLTRDLAVAAAMVNAMGAPDPMNPFDLIDDRISKGVLKATITDMRATYLRDGPGTRIEPRGLSAMLTKVGVQRATEQLLEPHFIDRAETWLYEQAQAGAGLSETDKLEKRLLDLMNDRDFVCVAGFCAFAALCELDHTAALLWYQTGGDYSGHPDIRAYAAQAREYLPRPRAGRRRKPSGKQNQTGKTTNAKSLRLVHCGAPTLTGSVCRHKVSATTKSCPAGHKQNRS